MYGLKVHNFRNPLLGQMAVPIVPQIDLAPVAPPAAPVAPGDGLGLGAIAGVLGVGMGVVSTLFYYSTAREAKGGTLRTTGYILSGVSALGTLLGVAGLGLAALADRR